MSHVVWKGQPFVYLRDEGHGLVIQEYHYRFDADGRLERMDLLTQPVLDILLQSLYPGDEKRRAIALAAYAETPQHKRARRKREEHAGLENLIRQQQELETPAP